MSGPYGWAGAALLIVALGCEAVGVFGLMWAAFDNALGQAGLWLIALLVSFPLFVGSWWLWRLGWKQAGTHPFSSMPNQQRTALLWANAVTILASVLGFGAFLYLAFRLQGSHRLAFALAALFLGLAISDIGSIKLREILRARLPSRFGRSQKWAWIFFGVSLASSGLFFLIGLFWPDVMGIQ
jgi:hypothetical protein